MRKQHYVKFGSGLAATLVAALAFANVAAATSSTVIDPTNTSSVIKVIKNVVGGELGASDFTIKLSFQADPEGPPTPASFDISFAGDSSGTYTEAGMGHFTVTEDAVAGYTTSYSGDCDSDITLTQLKTCTVTNTFVPTNFDLTLTKNGDGNGTVGNDQEEGTWCGEDCEGKSQSYASGTVVTLTATPNGSSNFDGSWSGACTGNNPTCVITMTGPMSVNAHFAANPPTSSGGGGGGGGGSTSSGGSGIPTPPSGSSGGGSGSGGTEGVVAGTSTTTSNLTVPPVEPQGQVLGATTELPRTGMPVATLLTVFVALAAVVDRKYKLV